MRLLAPIAGERTNLAIDPDDLLDDDARKADLEARFRELEREEELERLRKGGGSKKRSSTSAGSNTGPDDLSDMKAQLDDDAEPERFVLLLCPHCEAKNRTSLTKVRTRLPRCGGCHKPLSFTRG